MAITATVSSLTANAEYPFSVEPQNVWNGNWGLGPYVDIGFANTGTDQISDLVSPGWTEQVIQAEVTQEYTTSCGG